MKNHERPPVDFVKHFREVGRIERVANEKRRRAIEELAARACVHCHLGGCVHQIARDAINATAELEALRKISDRWCKACDGRDIPEINGKCAHVVARKVLEL